MTSVTITSKVWKAGKNVLVTTTPKLVRETLGITEGDIVETTYKLIKKAEKPSSKQTIQKEEDNSLRINTTY